MSEADPTSGRVHGPQGDGLVDPLPRFDNRITQLLGVKIPIANSPMGFVANPALVAAVAEAGGIGLVPGSVGIKWAQADIKQVRELTDRPFGVNLPISFVKNPKIADMLVAESIPFVTTSAGSPSAYTEIFKSAGLRVLHVVTSLDTAKEAVDAGVDGLIVEGIEGAGLRGKSEVATMVLLPLIAQKVDLPLITAGGIADGSSMAAAFALGAEGVQMGTRMLASVEANVHDGLKNAILRASETDTVLINRHNSKPFRVLRTDTTSALEFATDGDPVEDLLMNVGLTYTQGVLEHSIPSVGQVAGRIETLVPAAEIIKNTVLQFAAVISQLERRYLTTS
jgi:enoyl-[acyl-carrier protein] reductase II